jgi:hypothetical protein
MFARWYATSRRAVELGQTKMETQVAVDREKNTLVMQSLDDPRAKDDQAFRWSMMLVVTKVTDRRHLVVIASSVISLCQTGDQKIISCEKQFSIKFLKGVTWYSTL